MLLYLLLDDLHLVFLSLLLDCLAAVFSEMMKVQPISFLGTQLCSCFLDLYYHFSFLADVLNLWNLFKVILVIKTFDSVTGPFHLLRKQLVDYFVLVELRFEGFKERSFRFLYFRFKQRVVRIFKHVIE
jgi:hypothetical protein